MKIGDEVPDLELKNQNGEKFRFSELKGKKAFVVYFYPKDFTPGCTKEACSFRDSYEDFKELGAEVIGISGDSSKSHSKFIDRYKLPYIFLSDKDKKARNVFGVKPSLLGLLPGRETFVFDKNGKLLHRFNSMSAGRHMPEALAVLKKNQN
ncbi:peroxiredoxin [Christiangramia forsetii]|uniref:thioredoxin-dependent peroxiredoxin n=2 Tax=Christiangramia forsetii TaxID=411153 RepID=A0M3Y0_CHRFK|nr:peroxiredoxin [Christiangramia forsetii]GGG24692.1 peroxiredoxin [Christiangramia forsetii]CAL67325.1 peroxiredoxin [Christiangramia forsetii KT0803]